MLARAAGASALMERTANTLDLFLAPLSRETVATLRDGGDGWTTTEVMGHLRDFDGFFRGCSIIRIEQDVPQLPAYDHEANAIAARYNEQDLPTGVADFLRSRQETHAFFSGLKDEQRERADIHPERGSPGRPPRHDPSRADREDSPADVLKQSRAGRSEEIRATYVYPVAALRRPNVDGVEPMVLMNVGTMQFRSRVLERRVTFAFSLPLARHAGPGPYPALLQLHGWGGDHATWLHSTRLAHYLEGVPLVAIMPDGGNAHWFNQGPQARVEDFVMTDLLPACEEFFPIRRGRWALGGASMGGYGAVRLGLKYPDRFGSIIAHAGRYLDRAALDVQAPALTSEERADADVFAWARQTVGRPDRPVLRLDCGIDDPLLGQNRAFHRYLQDIGYVHAYTEYPGAHTADSFDERLRDALRHHREALSIEHATPA